MCLLKNEVDGVLRAAPSLVSFLTDMVCSFENARPLLAGQGQYSVVHLRRLIVTDCSRQMVSVLERDIRQHPSLQELGLSSNARLDAPAALNTPAALDALVDAVIACGLTGLRFSRC